MGKIDLVLYKYLLRKLVLFPVTFSRNKNFKAYNSTEGNLAIKRSKVIRVIINGLNENIDNENKNINSVSIKKLEDEYHIEIRNEALHLRTKYVIDAFEKEIIKEKLVSDDFYSFDD